MANWRSITIAWLGLAVLLTFGSAWLWWFDDVPFARPPHPWNRATIHFAGPWVIWAASGWLARRGSLFTTRHSPRRAST